MASVVVARTVICSELVRAAGGNPRLSTFRAARGDDASGTLDVPDVTQPALDAALAAYNQATAENDAITRQFESGIAAPFENLWEQTAFDQENRIRALEGLGPLTARQFRDLLRTRYRP